MKHIIFLLIVVAAIASCKKTGAPKPKETLLSKIFQNDTLTYEFEYSADRRLSRMKKYYADGFMREYTYEYDSEGSLKLKWLVNSSGKKTYKYIYETNSAGKAIKISQIPLTGADSGKVVYWSSFTYNAGGNPIRINNYMDDDVPAGYEILEYDGGRLTERKQYGEKNGEAKMVFLSKYTGPTNRIHPGILKAWVEPFEPEMYFFSAEAIYISYYEDGDKENQHDFNLFSREAGPTGGLWSSQTISIKKSYPIPLPIMDHRYMRYEYVEI
jgi:hypothetical protein